jgi:hypothetical protein
MATNALYFSASDIDVDRLTDAYSYGHNASTDIITDALSDGHSN